MTLKKSVSEWWWALQAFKYSSCAQIFLIFFPNKFLLQGLPATVLRTEEQNSESGAFRQPNEKAKFGLEDQKGLLYPARLDGFLVLSPYPSQSLI